MPKVEAILNDLETKIPSELPTVSQVLESDLQRIQESLAKQRNDRSYYAILKTMLSDVMKALGHKKYSQPLLEISLSQLQGKDFINDLKLKICEAIIECEEYHKVNIVEHNVVNLTDLNLKDPLIRARLEIVRAGMHFLARDFTRAALCYLSASREEAFLKDQKTKIRLISKAIGFCYIAPRNQDTHKIICTLCLNEWSQKSGLHSVLNKLYSQDILLSEESSLLEKQLPESLGFPDIDGVSVFTKARFSHNMIPILNAFKKISFKTLTTLLELQILDVLILLEKIYCNGELRIDQEDEYIEVTVNEEKEMSERKKSFLDRIDGILTSTAASSLKH